MPIGHIMLETDQPVIELPFVSQALDKDYQFEVWGLTRPKIEPKSPRHGCSNNRQHTSGLANLEHKIMNYFGRISFILRHYSISIVGME